MAKVGQEKEASLHLKSLKTKTKSLSPFLWMCVCFRIFRHLSRKKNLVIFSFSFFSHFLSQDICLPHSFIHSIKTYKMSQEEPEEKEIFPGVYFTDLRKNKGAPAASNPVYATQGEALQLEIRELENSIWHMKRSNQEINQVLQAEGHDQELVDAIEGQLTTLSPLVQLQIF